MNRIKDPTAGLRKVQGAAGRSPNRNRGIGGMSVEAPLRGVTARAKA